MSSVGEFYLQCLPWCMTLIASYCPPVLHLNDLAEIRAEWGAGQHAGNHQPRSDGFKNQRAVVGLEPRSTGSPCVFLFLFKPSEIPDMRGLFRFWKSRRLGLRTIVGPRVVIYFVSSFVSPFCSVRNAWDARTFFFKEPMKKSSRMIVTLVCLGIVFSHFFSRILTGGIIWIIMCE